MTKRKQHKPEFNARVALEVMKGEQTVGDLAEPVRRPPDDGRTSVYWRPWNFKWHVGGSIDYWLHPNDY